MHDHDAALARIADTCGVFLRREALAQGFDDKAIRRAVRAGEWARVRHGAYVPGPVWAAASPVERLGLRTRAVLRTHPGRVAASHHSACILHGLDLWDVDLARVHVTRLDGGAGRTDGDVCHHEGLCLEDDLVEATGHRVVRPVRAALESALLSGVERGLVVVDSGLRAGHFDLAQLQARHDVMRAWPGAQHLQLVTRLADGRSESVGESRARFLFWSQGLPMPELQFPVYDGGRLVGISDFAWPGHGLLGEFDGRVKYSRHLRPGEDPADAVFREKRREDVLRSVTGWAMIRLTWADLHEPARTAARIRALMRKAG